MIIKTQDDVTKAVLAEVARAPDARFKEIMAAFVRHLHDFAREVKLTEAEFQAAIAYIIALGQHSNETHNEAVLMSGSLGFSTLICLLNNGDNGQTETSANLLGPFWRMDSPPTANGDTIVRSPTPGPTLFVNAWFRDRDGQPIAGAEVDVWHSSPEGFYENQDPVQADMNLRGKFTTDRDGHIGFRSVKPAGYPIPIDGPVGDLLRAQGRHNMRPAHLHFLTVKDGFKTLISQVYVNDDKFLASDVQFGVTQHLIGNYVRHEHEKAPAPDVEGPWYSLDYTFVMERGRARLPRPPITGKANGERPRFRIWRSEHEMIRLVVALMACWLAAGAALAQTGAGEADWPRRSVRFIVPFPAGGSTDTVARVVGQLLGARLGQSFVIENRVGASGTIGTEAVARAAPDGYTIGLATTTTHALAASLSRTLPYDPVKDFAPVSVLGSSPFVMVITPGLPAQNLRDFIALAKSKPGALTYGSAGAASIAHLATVLFANMAQVSLTHVPYKASAESATDIMTGRIDMQLATVLPTLALLRAGTLRALGIASAQRSALLPDVPTIAEAGLPGYEASLWMAIVAPAGTPAGIVTRLNEAIAAVLATPEAQDALRNQGLDIETSTPAALASRIRDETGKWREVIRQAGIVAE